MGINSFDTAIAHQNGTGEQYVGRALRDLVKRDGVVLAAKFKPRSQVCLYCAIQPGRR